MIDWADHTLRLLLLAAFWWRIDRDNVEGWRRWGADHPDDEIRHYSKLLGPMEYVTCDTPFWPAMGIVLRVVFKRWD